MNSLLEPLLNLLESKEPVILATIVGRNGSAPRETGAEMVVQKSGQILGTIGGGQLEGKVISKAQELMATGQSILLEFHLTGKDAASSDMICGGVQLVLLEYLNPADKETRSPFIRAFQALKEREKVWWLVWLPILDQPVQHIHRLVVDKNAIVTSNQDDMQGLSVVMKSSESDQIHPSLEGCCPIIFVDGQKIDLGRVPESSLVQTAGEKIYVSALDVKGTVYIFGAGHVSQKLALITGMVGFRTVIVDDRAEFASTARFPSADQVMVVPDYDHLFEKIKLDAESYLVIVTRGHLYDKTVLAQAVSQEVVYTGMIGSKRKKKPVFKALLEEGITSDQLERVHSPIGLSIGAESPEEIAVSIVAELIKTRSEYYFRS